MHPRSSAVLAALLAACGDNVKPAADAMSPEPPACDVAGGEPALALERVADGLREPVHLTSPPGDPRLFVVELDAGRITILDRDGTERPRPFLQITDEIGNGFEQGLLSLAFHPRYADNGRFVISWARDGDDALVVEEWRVSADPDRADPDSRRVLLAIDHTTSFHYGAHVAFGADGLLYVASGDGGPQLDPEGHGQDLGSLRGKLLRVDVDREDAELPYAIPPDNPFVGVAGARPEIYAYGLRNPWRFAIDPVRGHVFLGDVGFDSGEEVDVIPVGTAGQNFGWPIVEGASDCVDDVACDTTGLVPPIYEYDHRGDQCAVIVGPVYRGCGMPGHRGKLFVGDFCEGWVRTVVYGEGEVLAVTDHPALAIPGALSAFGEDADGELYLLDHDEGTIDRIVPAPP